MGGDGGRQQTTGKWQTTDNRKLRKIRQQTTGKKERHIGGQQPD